MESIKKIKLHVKKNDVVQMLVGNDRGKSGKILKVFPEKSRVIVEGVNIRVKHQKPNSKSQTGSILKKEFPVHSSNVKKV